MILFALLIATIICWFMILIGFNLYYSIVDKNVPENLTWRITGITVFIMINLLTLAYCSN